MNPKRNRETMATVPEVPMAEINQLIAAHEGGLIRYVARLLKDEEYARDVVQETFIRLVGAGRDGSLSGMDNPAAWLYRVARNLSLDRLRANRRRPEVSLDEIPEDGHELHERLAGDERDRPDRMLARREELERVRQQILALDARSREILLLKVEHDRSYKEIAEIMGLTVGNVGFILHQAMKKLARGVVETAPKDA